MGILSLLIGPLTNLLGRVLPDPAAAQAAKLKLIELADQGALAELDGQVKEQLAAAGVVQAEAASKNWLASSWRPLTMLCFVALIIARMFGWTAPNVSAAEYLELWSLMKLGIGGYIGGRSLEKIAPSIANALKGK
jgi:hypothetical protein